MNKLQNKVALITGAASGIGKATAKLFLEENATVFVTDINEQLGQQVTEELKAQNNNAFFIHLDVTSEAAWQKAISQVEHTSKQLNILVNNAGTTLSMPLLDTSLEEWRRVMATNLDSVFLGTKSAIPLMQKSQQSSIINIASAFGLVGNPNSTAYCAGKAGVRLFTKAAALEFAKLSNLIRINSVCPGLVETPMWENVKWWPAFVKEKGSLKAAWQALATQKTAMGRVAAVDEIAKGILFLASDDASYITGTDLVIDGGATAQ